MAAFGWSVSSVLFTAPVIFSLSPVLLISDNSRFIFHCVPFFGTVRYLTLPPTVASHFPALSAQRLFVFSSIALC